MLPCVSYSSAMKTFFPASCSSNKCHFTLFSLSVIFSSSGLFQSKIQEFQNMANGDDIHVPC